MVGMIVVGVAHGAGCISSSSPLRSDRGPGGSDTPTRQKKVSPAGPEAAQALELLGQRGGSAAISGNAENDLFCGRTSERSSGVIWGCRCRPTAAAVSHPLQRDAATHVGLDALGGHGGGSALGGAGPRREVVELDPRRDGAALGRFEELTRPSWPSPTIRRAVADRRPPPARGCGPC